MDPDSYDPFHSPDFTLAIRTRTPVDSPKESLQLSPGADSRSLSPEEPQQHESSPEIHSPLLPQSAVTSPDEAEQCESTNTPPVAPSPGESGSALPSKTLPSNITGGPAESALSNLFRGHNAAQTSLDSSSEGKYSSSADTIPIFSDAYTANAETYRDPKDRDLGDRDLGDRDSEDMSFRTERLESVYHTTLSAAQPRGLRGRINNSHHQNSTSPQAVPQYTILRRPTDQVLNDIAVENKCPPELKPLPLPKDISSTTSLVALGAPVEEPKNPVDPIQYSVGYLDHVPTYFTRIPNDVLLGTHLTARAYNGIENNPAVQHPQQLIDTADFYEDLGQVLSTGDAQALALDSLSIYDLPSWNPRNDYRTWRMVPRQPGQPVTERRNGYRDCTREQLAWIEMMCSTFGTWMETGSMMKFENLSEEDLAEMFFKKFACAIPKDWTHLADDLRKGIVKMLCYRQGSIL